MCIDPNVVDCATGPRHISAYLAASYHLQALQSGSRKKLLARNLKYDLIYISLLFILPFSAWLHAV